MKISLQELTARSESCKINFRLTEIAEAAKSPTAAYELALHEKFNEAEAKACRYLRMIKRDYGQNAFKAVVERFDSENKMKFGFFSLLPFLQVANRFSYLKNKAKHEENTIFSERDSDYADVVEGMIMHIDEMNKELKDELLKSINSNPQYAMAYIGEAEGLVERIRNRREVDKYRLEKTITVLGSYVCTLGKKYNIPLFVLYFSDRINSYSRNRKP